MKGFIQATSALAIVTTIACSLSNRAVSAEEDVKAQSMRKALASAIENRPMAKRSTQRPYSTSSATGIGVAYYSAQRPQYPPLPYTPFPELPLYKTGEGRYVYDDRSVDYEAIRRESMASAAIEADQPVANGEENPAPPAAQQQAALSILINRVDASHFELIASNLTVGNDYLLTDKLELADDIRVNWAPLLMFTATAPTAAFEGPFIDDQDFFRAWDLNAYAGPVVNLTSPSAGATLSGKIKVTGGVSDIFSDRVAELYVDGDFHRAITNGPLELELDTQLFGNGQHTLDVVVRTVQFGTDRLEYATVASVGTVTFDNFLSSVDNAPLFSPDLGAPVFVFQTTGPADYQLDIADESQNLVRSILGSTPGGTFQVAWDLLDQNNNPVPLETGYVVTLTATPQGGGAGPG